MTAVTPLQEAELVGRLALSCGLAGVLGWERQLGQQPAGLRTHMLVSLGAAAFTVAGIYGVAGHGTIHDAGRVAAQIVVGIGFIGAGSIWRSGNERVIRGLTTAASIWVAASIGMLCGYGMYVLAVGAAAITLLVLRLLIGLERLPARIARHLAPARREFRADAALAATDDALDGGALAPREDHDPPLIERQRERRRGKARKKAKRQRDRPADAVLDAT